MYPRSRHPHRGRPRALPRSRHEGHEGRRQVPLHPQGRHALLSRITTPCRSLVMPRLDRWHRSFLAMQRGFARSEAGNDDHLAATSAACPRCPAHGGSGTCRSRSVTLMWLRVYCSEASRSGWKSHGKWLPRFSASNIIRRDCWLSSTSRLMRANVELRLHLGAELPRQRVCRGQVVQLLRIVIEIEELVGVGGRMDEFPGPPPQHVHGRDGAFRQIFAPGGAVSDPPCRRSAADRASGRRRAGRALPRRHCRWRSAWAGCRPASRAPSRAAR